MPAPHPALQRPGIERAIVWLSLFGLLVIMVLMALLIVRDRDETARKAGEQAQLQALLLAEHAARLFDSAELALTTVIDETRGANLRRLPDAARIHRRLSWLAQRLPYVEAFWLHGPAGVLRISSLAHPPPDLDASDQEFFVAHIRDPDSGVHVSGLTGRADGRPTFRLSRRLEDAAGGFRGVASLTIEVPFFRNFYGRLPLPANSCVRLLRAPEMTELVAQPPSADADADVEQATRRLVNMVRDSPEAERFQEAWAADGTRRVVAYRKVSGFPLYVTVAIPIAATASEWRERVVLRLAEAGTAILILGLLTTLALREAGRQRIFQQTLEHRVANRTAELETAVQEVHHRVRNNLQIVGSLLTMQVARVRDAEVRDALSESIGRVHTLSLVHQAMYGSGGIDRLAFRDYLAELAGHLGDLYGGAAADIRVDGDNPTLSLQTAVPLALIVHEALSNALSHAFPGRSGTVSIGVADEPAGLRVTIDDDGVGLPPERRDGLGMKIMRTLAAQVGAEIHLEARPGGGTRVIVSRSG